MVSDIKLDKDTVIVEGDLSAQSVSARDLTVGSKLPSEIGLPVSLGWYTRFNNDSVSLNRLDNDPMSKVIQTSLLELSTQEIVLKKRTYFKQQSLPPAPPITKDTVQFIVNSTGNVGIGTGEPQHKLDVADRMRVRQAKDTAGIWFFQTKPAKDQAFVGMADDTQVGFWGGTGAGWGFVMDTTTGNVNFGAKTRQMINLWKAEYGIGIQAGTQYFRTASDFCWFKGGTHHDGGNNPGGGARLMAVNGFGDLILSARTNPEASPTKPLCRAMVDLGAKLAVNYENDFVKGVDLFNARFVASKNHMVNTAALSLEEATLALQRLSPVKFNYRNDPEKDLCLGFVAEDVPDLVATRDRTAIGALDIVALLTKVVQDQQQKIAQLTAEVNILKQKNA